MEPVSPEQEIGDLLRKGSLRLATAESCTGGLIGHRLTNIAGSSEYFVGGIIAYSNEIKMNLLQVNAQTLKSHGAVSQETVIEMARGVCKLMQADIGLAVSGIAGPGGGSLDKPVGLVWIGLKTPVSEGAWRDIWTGSRVQIKEQAAEKALRLLLAALRTT